MHIWVEIRNLTKLESAEKAEGEWCDEKIELSPVRALILKRKAWWVQLPPAVSLTLLTSFGRYFNERRVFKMIQFPQNFLGSPSNEWITCRVLNGTIPGGRRGGLRKRLWVGNLVHACFAGWPTLVLLAVRL